LTADSAGFRLTDRHQEGTVTIVFLYRVAVAGVLAIAYGVLVDASTDSDDKRLKQFTSDRDALVDIAAPLPLRVQRVRLEPAPPINTSPSTVLKFDLFNASVNRITDLLLKIAIIQKVEPLAPRRVLVGPFNIRGDVVLEAGYTLNYQMLLRNFSSDCDCVANVDVISVRSLLPELQP
jgi:hypothetical protein